MSEPNAWQLEQAFSAWMSARARILHEDPDLEHDETALSDLLRDEEQDVQEIIRRLIRVAIEADLMATATEERRDELDARAKRFRSRQQTAKSAAFAAWEALGFIKLPAPDFTLSKNSGRAGVHITDENALPPEFVKVERTPKKADIAAALAAKREVPGATLTNPIPYMVIRRT